MCRAQESISSSERRKIALFTNVGERAVISALDASNIYQIPENLHAEGLDDIVVDKLNLTVPPANLTNWKKVVSALENPSHHVSIAMVGKYVDLTEAYKSLSESLVHAGIHTDTRVEICYVDAEAIEKNGTNILEKVDGILVPGGFGERGIDGKVMAVTFARERQIPFLGICLGMQMAIIEVARNLAGLAGAHSTEFNKATEHPVVALITEWAGSDGAIETRDGMSDMGGTMRLGAQPCRLASDSIVGQAYGNDLINERHRHRYEFNNTYTMDMESAGLKIVGRSLDGNLVEIVELSDHPWFVGCQFHPEFSSTPRDGHPLFNSFVRASLKHERT